MSVGRGLTLLMLMTAGSLLFGCTSDSSTPVPTATPTAIPTVVATAQVITPTNVPSESTPQSSSSIGLKRDVPSVLSQPGPAAIQAYLAWEELLVGAAVVSGEEVWHMCNRNATAEGNVISGQFRWAMGPPPSEGPVQFLISDDGGKTEQTLALSIANGQVTITPSTGLVTPADRMILEEQMTVEVFESVTCAS